MARRRGNETSIKRGYDLPKRNNQRCTTKGKEVAEFEVSSGCPEGSDPRRRSEERGEGKVGAHLLDITTQGIFQQRNPGAGTGKGRIRARLPVGYQMEWIPNQKKVRGAMKESGGVAFPDACEEKAHEHDVKDGREKNHNQSGRRKT